MESKVFLQDDIIEVQVIGAQTGDTIVQMGKLIEALLDQQKKANKPLFILDDVTAMAAADGDARKLVVELAKTLPYEKLAMVGKGGIVRLGANLILQTIGRHEQTKYFDNRQDAIAWLKNES